MIAQPDSGLSLHLAPQTVAGTVPATTIDDDTTRRHVRKYETRNPIQRWLLHRFHEKAWRLIQEVQPRRVLDFGCGEAFFWKRLSELGPLPEITGLDLRQDALQTARALLPNQNFRCCDLFDLDAGRERFDLVVASEVLEHLYEPERFLARLCTLTKGPILLTVPHEPWFRLGNLLRGRDVLRLGNHPEHVQQWSVVGFRRFVSDCVHVQRIETSFPWILLLGTRK